MFQKRSVSVFDVSFSECYAVTQINYAHFMWIERNSFFCQNINSRQIRIGWRSSRWTLVTSLQREHLESELDFSKGKKSLGSLSDRSHPEILKKNEFKFCSSLPSLTALTDHMSDSCTCLYIQQELGYLQWCCRDACWSDARKETPTEGWTPWWSPRS